MTKKSKATRKSRPSRPSAAARPAEQAAHGAAARPSAASTATFALGLATLIWCVLMSLLLVIEHIGGVALPGCGEGGACEQAANSIWGKVPLINWPVAYLGLAYFLGAIGAWAATRGALPTPFRHLVRLGALGSLFFSAIIVIEWLFCPYCIASHVGNFAFWLTMECTKKRASRIGRPIAAFGLLFVIASIGSGAWAAAQQAKADAAAEVARAQTVEEVIKRSRPTEPTPEPPPEAEVVVEPPEEHTAPAEPPDVATPEAPPPFTGRYRLGPEEAPIRIVMITDYQCRDCRRVEDEVMRMVRSNDDISLSVKHFPFNRDCNQHVSRTMHANSCWAARAAEAAGILYGNDGFWKMHEWLFARGGGFTNRELQQGLLELDFDRESFYREMQGDEANARIAADCDEAKALGLYFTPMIFINGVEFKGWNAPQAVARTIAELAAANLPPRPPTTDHPPVAIVKYVEDWQDWEPLHYRGGPFRLPIDAHGWPRGPENAKVRIVVWGDYQEPGTAEADQAIRAWLEGRTDARYTFRHYPFSSECNPKMPYERHVLACWASRVAEAAGLLGGTDVFWRVHAWLMDTHDAALAAAARSAGVDTEDLRTALYAMTEEDREKSTSQLGVDAAQVINVMRAEAERTLRAAAPDLGLDADALLAAMQRPEVQAAILDDIEAGKGLPVLRHGTRPGLHAIPTIFINDRYVPRWRIDREPVLDRIMDAAAAQ